MRSEDRHSFSRKNSPTGMRHCKRCRLGRRWTPEGWRYLDRQGWTDKAPPCLQVRSENETRERRLLERIEVLLRDPLDDLR